MVAEIVFAIFVVLFLIYNKHNDIVHKRDNRSQNDGVLLRGKSQNCKKRGKNKTYDRKGFCGSGDGLCLFTTQTCLPKRIIHKTT